MGKADNMARSVVWLVSDESKFFNGAEPVIDRG